MDNMHSYKDGFREGVVFCFYKDGKILLEDRGKGFEVEAFFPNGSIELKDKEFGGDEYILYSLNREVNEEFNRQIIIKDKKYLGEIKVPEINVLFYVYCITAWDGIFPSHIIEDGEPDSVIEFFGIPEARDILKFDSALEILRRVESSCC